MGIEKDEFTNEVQEFAEKMQAKYFAEKSTNRALIIGAVTVEELEELEELGKESSPAQVVSVIMGRGDKVSFVADKLLHGKNTGPIFQKAAMEGLLKSFTE